MGATERIKQYIDYKGITKYQFCKELGFSNKFLDNSSNMGTDKAGKILHYYPEINSEWLLTGKGEMLKSDKPKAVPAADLREGFPLVYGTALGGFGNSKFSIEERDVKEYYIIPKFNHKQVDFMIEVEGSSMYPKYNSGDVVACRIINEKGFIQWNKTHVVATKEQGIIIKRIKKGPEDSLLMVSDNKDYDPFTISGDEIDGLALVVGVIRLE